MYGIELIGLLILRVLPTLDKQMSSSISLCNVQVLTFSLHTLVPSTKGSVGGDAEGLTWLNDFR